MNGFEDCFIRNFENKNYLSGKCKHIRIPANETKGFNFEYVLYIPENVSKNTRIILNPMNYTTDKDFTEEEGIEYLYETSKSFRQAIHFCNSSTNYCIIRPLIPRYYDEILDMEIYTNQLASTCFLNTINKKYLRIDNQIINMINDAKERLMVNDIIVSKKIIVEGFSAAGKFANRFTILHPEMVELCIAGGLAGTLILPLKETNNEKLIYPIGIYNIEEINENTVNQFRNVKQFYYYNTNDKVDSFYAINGEPYFKGIIMKDEMELLYKVLGKNPIDRWNNSKKYYSNMCNVTFKEYNEEHSYNTEIMNDIKKLIDNIG